MNVEEYQIIQLIKAQMKDQGCLGDSLESLKLMQPHLYEWIVFFDLEDKFVKEVNDDG